jgi:hypothetical protein
MEWLLVAQSGHSPKRRSQLSCQDGRLCVPPRVADRALAGIDRGARCRSARTTGLVPALEEAFALAGTERKPDIASRPVRAPQPDPCPRGTQQSISEASTEWNVISVTLLPSNEMMP